MARPTNSRLIDLDLLRTRVEEGATVPEMVGEFGCSKQNIHVHMKNLGLSINPVRITHVIDPKWLKKQKKALRSDASIAEELGVPVSVVARVRREYGIEGLPHTLPKRKPMKIDAEWLRGQKKAGRSDPEIAEELGVSRMTVYRALKRHSIHDTDKNRMEIENRARKEGGRNGQE